MAKIFVAMSGGVDSSVAAAVLKKENHDVTGVFIKTWHPPFLKCTWRDERRDAMRVCAQLGIEFMTLHLEAEYKKEVVDYMIAEYAEGRTPNPDVMCNDKIKFGAFFRAAKKEGADYIATGHYARTLVAEDGTTRLCAGVDTNKDQSYFLWRIPQETLAHVLFPVGEYTKPEVRERARDFGLSVAEKKDSQGVCFLGHVDIRDFLKRFIPVQPGVVLDEQGNAIGTHEGALLYTLGQRHGFSIHQKKPDDGAFYIVKKDVHDNTLTVSQHLKTKATFDVSSIVLEHTNWISGSEPESGVFRARFRYRQELFDCHYDAESKTVHCAVPQKSVALGQSLVLYRADEVVGGGVITAVR